MPGPRDTWDLAGALLDGEPVDWSRFEREGATGRGTLIGALQSLAAMARSGSAGVARGPDAAARSSPWTLAILVAAASHILIGLAGFAAGYGASSPVPPAGSALVVIVFSAAAMWLFAGGRHDLRARRLGGFYLLVAAAFARRFAGITAGTPLDALVRGVFPDAFLAAFLWSFVSRFPRVLRFSGADRFCRAALRISVAGGVLLFAVNLVLAYLTRVPASHLLHRGHGSGLYWAIVLGLCAAALPAILARTRLAPPDERRRVAFFCGVLLSCVSPVVLETLAEIVLPGFSESMSRPVIRRVASYALFAILLVLPFATAYAVLVERILDVRVIVGRALQYLLARGTLILLSVAPFGLLVVFGTRNRELTIGELFSGETGIAVLSLTAAGVVLLSTRHRLLAFVDRIFMGTAVDLTGELTRVAADLGRARSRDESVELVEDAIERATGAGFARVYLLEHDQAGFAPVRGGGQSLSVDSACAALLREDSAALAVGPAEPGTLWSMLPPLEGRWVADSRSAVLVPLRSSADSLSGFIAVGSKRSGLPFAAAELPYLSGVSGAMGLALAQHGGAAPQIAPEDDPARECLACGRVLDPAGGDCTCGGVTRVAALPGVLNGKFSVEARLGAGGMGIVYRGLDCALDRPVALKTLSRLSAAAAGRLAQEAKVMAAVVHPHLATIYGVERWRGTPVLVVELCERGTLADRLRCERLSVGAALRLGLDLARALEELHSAGVLHRDVKPSNIGFLANGAAKLLDFGIASYAAAPLASNLPSADDDEIPRHTQTIEVRSRHVAGTPLYMSPEVVRGAEADARLDLWALALVVYEGLAGRHPFAAATVPEVLARVRKTRIPDLRDLRPDCPEPLARAFRRWLAPEASVRPQTAGALAGEIESLFENRW